MSNNGQGLKLINDKYITKKKISSGSFGVVYAGQDITTREYVAIKVEKSGGDDSSLDREAEILTQLQNVPQTPKLYYSGTSGDSRVLVIQFLGRDLTHFMKTFRKFSLKCVLNIAEQMINIIENIHKKYRLIGYNKVLHRDIKPENVLVGRNDESQQLYIVDFGISKFYRDQHDAHINYKEGQPFIGTTRYASLAAHKGQALSRKDDLESLGYMLIFLLKGQLPWQNLQYTSEQEKVKQVGQMKLKMDINELCKGIPIEFGRFIDYVRNLPFKTEPNYKYCQQLFKKLQIEQHFSPKDLLFDWDLSASSTKQGDRSHRKSSVDPTKSSKFKPRKNDGEIGSGYSIINNSIMDAEMNSLLKLPEQQQKMAQDRRKGRLGSMSSYNDTYSELDPNNSVMLGIHASMLSRLSKLSFNSQSFNKDSSKFISMTPEIKACKQEKKQSQSPYLQNLGGQRGNKRMMSELSPSRPMENKEPKEVKKQIKEDTINDFQHMNDHEDGLTSIAMKYQLLKNNSVHARFKKCLQPDN